MKIEIEFEDKLVGYCFKKGRKIVQFDELSKAEQIRVCNAFAGGYNLFVKAIKEA